MTSPTATAEIERLAREATPGRWDPIDARGLDAPVNCVDFAVVGPEMETCRVWKEADARYIAAVSPDGVLGILAEHRAAVERCAELKKYGVSKKSFEAAWEGRKDESVIAAESARDTALAALRAAEAERDAALAALEPFATAYEAWRKVDPELAAKWAPPQYAELYKLAWPISLTDYMRAAALQSTTAKEG